MFITGTDTGVGKTVISAAVVSLLRVRGIDAFPMKPVQTGCLRHGKEWTAPDLEFCLRMAGLKVSQAEKRLMMPYGFKKACSPHLAAALEHRRIGISSIQNSFRILRRRHDLMIVEGAGGLLVPLNERNTMLDLMKALALPVILVARPGLGTINHTLLSLGELRWAGLPVAGVIFNETKKRGWGLIERDNMAVIARRGRVRILGRLPFISDWESPSFRSFCERHLHPMIPWLNSFGREESRPYLSNKRKQSSGHASIS
ncbi:MAG: dethiobiotin synthase [Verrucomicrobia bacterium]|nr:dethiobiotin synthase [Verrucomicrobiota bacterium]